MGKPSRARLATPAELFAFRKWETDLVGKANARWRELHPAESDHTLIDLNSFAAALLALMAPTLREAARNRSFARRYAAAIFADSPERVREFARSLIRSIYDNAMSQRECTKQTQTDTAGTAGTAEMGRSQATLF